MHKMAQANTANTANTARSQLAIGLTPDGIGVIQSAGWWRRTSTVLADAPFAADGDTPSDMIAGRIADRIADQLRTLLTQTGCQHLPAHIIVADAWVRYFMVTPPHNTQRIADCRAAAEMRFQTLYGDAHDGWQIIADWDARRPFLACAMPRALLAAQQQAASACKLRLLGITPHFVAAWNQARRQLGARRTGTAWFGLAHDDVLTLGAIGERGLCAVRAAAFPRAAWQDQQTLPEHLRREALRLNLAMPETLHLCGDVPGSWAGEQIGPVACIRADAGQAASIGLQGTTTTLSAGLRLALQGVRR
jgi:hypothetical protein